MSLTCSQLSGHKRLWKQNQSWKAETPRLSWHRILRWSQRRKVRRNSRVGARQCTGLSVVAQGPHLISHSISVDGCLVWDVQLQEMHNLKEWVTNKMPHQQKRSRGQEEAATFSFLCSFQTVYQEEPCILLPHKTAAEIYLLSSSFYVCTSASPGILSPTPNLYINV